MPELIETSELASAGGPVQAALLYAGENVQSILLDVFDAGLSSSLGGLFLTASVVAALMIVALGGKYKFGLYIFVGSALFLFATVPRTHSGGIKWQRGAVIHGYGQVERAQEGLVDPKNVRVSSLYAWWSIFTSDLTQSFISLLRLTDTNSDLQFIQRTGRYQASFQMKVADPQLQEFIDLIFLSPECIELFNPQFLQAQEHTEFNPELLEKRIAAMKNRAVLSKQNNNWQAMGRLLQKGSFGTPPHALTQKDSYTCTDIWDLALFAIERHAKDQVDLLASRGKAEGISANEVLREMADNFGPQAGAGVSTEQRIAWLINFVAGKMLVNSVQSKGMRPEVGRLFTTENTKAPKNPDTQSIAGNLRYLAKSYEYLGKGDFLSSVLALPYLQGLILYFLALAYPLFACFLIIPGRHHMLAFWAELVLWVQLWHFDFAVVMLIDELLYNLLPRGPALTDEQLKNPAQAFQILFQADPIYSVQTVYYLEGALLIGSIAATGALVRKGSGKIQDAVSEGFREFGGKTGTSMQAFSRMIMASNQLSANEKYIQEHAMEEGIKRTFSDPNIIKALSLNMSQMQAQSLLQSNPKGFMKAVSQTQKAASNDTNKYVRQLVNSTLQANVNMAAWEIATRDPNVRRRAHNAVMGGWFSHGGYNAYSPTKSLEKLAVAQYNFQWGSTADAAINSLFTLGG